MSLKGRIDPDHIPANKYELAIIGLLTTVTFIEVSGLEQEVGVIDLPDRTRASGGQRSASEITVKVPAHHSAEVIAMDRWWQESQDPISILAKKSGTMTYTSGTGIIERAYSLVGAWPSKRTLPEAVMLDPGAMQVLEYTIQIDDFRRIT
jgi:hypothetical protein